MNLGHQIKYYRQRDHLSQESLVEKLYVSRQTISNWENDKSYPDIHNLLMLSSLFDVSLDDLVKGDVEIMERKLKESRFNLSSHLMIWPMLIAGILIGPAMYYWGAFGLILEILLLGTGIIASFKVERFKKSYQIQTYDRIVAFMNGKEPNEVHSSNLRNLITSIYSFVLVVGIFIAVVLISIYLFKP